MTPDQNSQGNERGSIYFDLTLLKNLVTLLERQMGQFTPSGAQTVLQHKCSHVISVLFYICSLTQFNKLSSPMVCTPCRKKNHKNIYVRAALCVRACVRRGDGKITSGVAHQLLCVENIRTRLSPTFKTGAVFVCIWQILTGKIYGLGVASYIKVFTENICSAQYVVAPYINLYSIDFLFVFLVLG